MKLLLKRLFFIGPLFFSAVVFGQEKHRIGIDAGLEVVNRYIWRGTVCSDAMNFQPYMTVDYGCFSLTGFGSYAASKNFAEVDLIASLSLGNFELTVSDYFNENEEDLEQNKFLSWKKGSTAHLIESTLSYDLPFEKFPLKLSYGMMLYGADTDDNDNQNYSTYLELMYPFTYKDYTLSAFVGGTANAGFYGTKASVVNAGISMARPIQLSENYALGLNASFIVNPNADNVFIVVGIAF